MTPNDDRASERFDRRAALEAFVTELDEEYGEPDQADIDRFRDALSKHVSGGRTPR